MNRPMARMTGANPPPADLSQKTIRQFGDEMGVNADLLASVLDHLAQSRLLSNEPIALSADEVSFLEEHSGAKPNVLALVQARIVNAVEESADYSEAMTVKEAANLLGVSESRVRHRLSDGSLYAYKSDGRGVERKLPRWQFRHNDVIPHLGEVLNALPEDFTPLDAKAFFMNARVDHPTRDETFNVRDWLANGGDPGEVIALAHEQQYAI